MIRAEEKVLNFAERHLDLLVVAAVTIIGFLIRYGLRDLVSVDADAFLIPWYREIKDQGGLRALGGQVGNYNMLYQTLIALFTYLPVKPLYAYKMLSVFFDYGLAVLVGRLVYTYAESGRKWKGIFAYGTVLLSPLVFLNSSAWGQCDAIYVCFEVLALFMMCREKTGPAFVFLGAALSFKLQAVFLLPFFLLMYLGKKCFSALYFFILPAVMCVLNLAGVIMGRSFLDIFRIYLDQTSDWPAIVKNYPSVWLLLTEPDSQLIVLLAPIILISGISGLTSMQFLIPSKRQKEYTISIVCGSVVNIILNIIFITHYAARGAALASVISELIILICQIMLIWKEFKLVFILWKTKRYCVYSLIMSIVIYIVTHNLAPTIMTTIIQALLGGAIYFLILFIAHDPYLNKVLFGLNRKRDDFM